MELQVLLPVDTLLVEDRVVVLLVAVLVVVDLIFYQGQLIQEPQILEVVEPAVRDLAELPQ
jgi:hypothetical protein